MGVKYVCKLCGSTKIYGKADISWDEKNQQWVITHIYTEATCDGCNSHSELKKIDP